ncbi:MAG TPA: ketopantoate reductase family protein [Stellaceae bacterium]|jgi:2-dehydropantoate 2-reductase|nr:ketopantoate reductase family protein [Stellaceae bacterium]
MKVVSLGAGAIGGYFGGRLVEGGCDVTFLVREARKALLQKNGLRIESSFGNFSGKVSAVARHEIAAPADLVLLTCKSYDLPSAIETIRPAVGPKTAILPLLNGLSHIDDLNRVFGAERVLGGFAKIAVTMLPNGTIKHLSQWRYITFGEQNGTMSERIAAIKALFDRSSVVAAAVPDIMTGMWEKLVHLATVAGATAVMRANLGEIARTNEGAALMIELLETNAAIATRAGFAPSVGFLDEYRALLSDRQSTNTASMLRDIENKGQIEADHIIGYLLNKAREYGVDDRLLRVIYVHLKAYEQRREAGRL